MKKSSKSEYASQIIFHTHIHIIPRFQGDGFTHWHGARDYAEGEVENIAMQIKTHLS